MTTTVFPGATPPRWAAWCPVRYTSDSVSSEGMSASSVPAGTTTAVPSACGTRRRSAWVADPAPSKKPPCTHDVVMPSRQNTHVLSDQAKGTITVSPTARVRTSSPISSTTPMAS